jgi:hypothetical protein
MDEQSEQSSSKPAGRWELAAHLVRDRRLGFAMVGGGLLYILISSGGLNPLPCPLKQATGLPCPGCGMSRSCLAFLKGDFLEVVRQNPFGPVFAAFWVVVGIGVVLPQPWRGRFADCLGRVEQRTRWALWVGLALAIYSLTRWLPF